MRPRLANTYYMGKMLTNEGNRSRRNGRNRPHPISDIRQKAAHANISGMLIAKNAPNKENAMKLMEFLAER